MKHLLLALALALCITATAETIGIRNNNPGNIRPFTEGKWKGGFPGAVGISKENYLIFKRPIDGVRAIVINLKIYSRKHHIKTAKDIVERWTKGEGAPEAKTNYAWEMVKNLPRSPEDKLNMESPRVLLELTRAIVRFENGKDPYPASLYSKVFPTCGIK